MGGDAKQFTRDLQALYVAAGSPPLTWIVSQGSGQKPPVVFSDSTLSDWLKKGAVPANAAHFKVLVSLLEGRAANRVDPADPDSNYKPRGFLTWEKARAAARTERRPGLGGESTHAQVQDPSSEPAASEAVLGVPIGQCDPLDLEVHPAGDGPGRNAQRHLPGYVRRAHDDVLAAVVERVLGGASELAVLVGSSSTGKTRACWEAVQPLAQLGWRLWHPFDPTRADVALAGLEAVGPRTVVWLNEMQHYLDR